MKVVCDNCGAVYKVPDDKLVKPVNKATCRQCGHRMLIPRPRADQDPNERTLVTAVPPTPMGAPMRELSGERRTTPIDDEPEKTLPGRPAPAGFNRRSMARDEVPVFPGTPLPAGTRSNNPTSDVMRAAGDTVKSPGGSPPPEYPRGMPPSDPQSEPSMPPRLQQRPRTPPPAARRNPPSQPEPRRASTPRPMVRSHPPPSISQAHPQVAQAYDPSGDLTLAMAGVFGTIAGIFILSLLSVWPWRSVLLFGLMVSIGGAITALLILITGGRGTRPAWLGTSVVTGGILAVALSIGIVSTHYVGERIVDLDLGQLARTIDFGRPPPVDPVLPVDLIDPEPVGPEPGVADGGDPVMPTPTPDPKIERPKPPPRPDPVPSRPTPRPDPVPSPLPSPLPSPVPMPMPVAPMPPPEPAAPSSVSFDVIDVMLRNNLEIKKCFYEVLQTTGQLPNRVDVRFTLMPSGSVTGVKIQQTEFANSPLENCLGSAIRAVTFPQSSGNGQKIVYPFVLQ